MELKAINTVKDDKPKQPIEAQPTRKEIYDLLQEILAEVKK